MPGNIDAGSFLVGVVGSMFTIVGISVYLGSKLSSSVFSAELLKKIIEQKDHINMLEAELSLRRAVNSEEFIENFAEKFGDIVERKNVDLKSSQSS